MLLFVIFVIQMMTMMMLAAEFFYFFFIGGPSPDETSERRVVVGEEGRISISVTGWILIPAGQNCRQITKSLNENSQGFIFSNAT